MRADHEVVLVGDEPLGPGAVGPRSSLDARARVEATLPASRVVPVVVIAAMTVVLVGVLVVGPDGPVDRLAFLTATTGAAAMAVVGARRQPDDRRQGWLLVAVGLALAAAGDVLYQVLAEAQGTEPDISLADPVWLASYVAMGAGVLVLVDRSAPRRGADRALELAAPVTVSLLLVWQLAVGPTVADTSNPLGVRLVWSLYPVVDALLLSIVLQAVVRGLARTTTALLLASGLSCWLVADLFYAMPATADEGTLLDVAWMVGPACIAMACWPVRRSSPFSAPLDGLRLGRRLALASLLPLLVPGLIEVWGFVAGERVNPYPLLAATTVLVALAYVRIDRLLQNEARQRRALISSERYFRALSAQSSDAVVVLDRDGRMVDPNRNPGSPHPDWDLRPGEDPMARVLEADRPVAQAVVERALRHPGQVVAGEVRVRHPGAGERWLVARVVNLLHDPDVEGLVVTLLDVTERKRAEAELARQALQDGLTGLPNRTLLRDRIEHLLARTTRVDRPAAVLVLGLDGFKAINDTLGHDVGDEVLRQVAGRLLECVDEADTVARLSGDEFALVVDGDEEGLGQTATIAERVLASLAEPVVVGPHRVALSASVGFDLAVEGAQPDHLLRDAELAMHRAKARGAGRWARYEPSMRVAAVERMQLESALPGALAAGQLRLVHQPVVSLSTGRLVGFEALLRWTHPDLGEVSPERFIPVAEETGAIVELGRFVLDEACAQAVRWNRRARQPLVTVAVNVSGRQLASHGLVDDVREALSRHGLPARALVLEVTETALVEDADVAREQLVCLRGLGVRVAIDDFGTGYSSLGYLRHLPVDVLKIDRSFVGSIEDDRSTPGLLRGLLELGRTLGLEVVAEGVERPEQHQRLQDEHCERAQGFLYSPPLEAADAMALVDEGDVEVAGAVAARLGQRSAVTDP